MGFGDRPTFSVISANARAALRCKSTFSEYERVERARRGSPVKKLVSDRSVDKSKASAAEGEATGEGGG
jgi:hypothetical protein